MSFCICLSLSQLADLTTTIASVAVVIGIGVAWSEYNSHRADYKRQVDDSTRQADDSRIALQTGMTKYLNEVAKVFIEFPEMRQYFHEGKEPSDEDRARAEAIAVNLANVMDHALDHLHHIAAPDRGAWERYFDYVLETSPVLIDYLDEHGDWYGVPLQQRFAARRGR